MRSLIIIVLFLSVTNLSLAQPYVYIDTDTKGMIQSNAKWVDVNNDGFLDLIVTGERYSANKQIISTYLYLNDKNGNFYKKNSGLDNLYRSCISYVDIDKDGDQDILLSGETNSHSLVTRIYKNNGWGYFTSSNPGIIGVRDGAVDIADYDRNGKYDIVICGENNGIIYSKIYKGLNNTFVEINSNLIPLYSGSVEFGDYNNDNYPDILLSGETSEGIPVTKVYRNSTKGSFVDTEISLIGIKHGKALWADFDGDDDLDIFIAGEAQGMLLLSRFYRNDGNNVFTEIKPNILGARDGNIQASDYDCDGDIDLLVSGETAFGPNISIYRNSGNFVFETVETNLPGIYLGGAYWGDYDKDCDKELFLIGLDDCYNFIAKLYRNDIEVSPVEKIVADNSLWIKSNIVIKDRPDYYYFVWSSCFCSPDKGKYKDYYTYVSNIHFIREQYQLQKRFNSIIVKSIPDWGEINGGHRVSIGYKTKAEAEAARRQIIRDYKSERFTVNYVNW